MSAEEALQQLLRYLKSAGYSFTVVTPATHTLVLARPLAGRPGLRDILGWSRPFDAADLDPALLSLLEAADALDPRDGQLRSKLRVASLGDDLLLHSAFPTEDVDSVFFGPDTYRFASFIEQQLPAIERADWLVDLGTGSGAGAIATAWLRPFARVTMVDVNDAALRLARINAAAAGLTAEAVKSGELPAGADLIIANPPYMMDADARSYRDGGGLLGGTISLEWARQGLERLAPGGTMLLYTGAAFVDGRSPLLDALGEACPSLSVTELDPDVFGEELQQPHYACVERIAAIGAVIRK